MEVRRLLETVGGVEELPYKRPGRSELMAIEGLRGLLPSKYLRNDRS